MAQNEIRLPSAIFFNPQSKAAEAGYLESLHRYLNNNEQLHPFSEAIRSLPQIWDTLAAHDTDLAASNVGKLSAKAFTNWIDTTNSDTIASGMSGSLTLPLLVIIQACQYIRYLDLLHIRHHELLQSLSDGGVHGYCGGLLPAVAVATSANEGELVQNVSRALRLAFAIGTYSDLRDEDDGGPTNMVIRLKQPGQGDDIVRYYPGAYISAVTDPKTISIVGPAAVLEQVKNFTDAQGLLSQNVHIRGKVHNPENEALAADLNRFCTAHDSFRLPSARQSRVVLRSNTDGSRVEDQSLIYEIIKTILSGRSEWYKLLQQVAGDLGKSDRHSHHLINFGIGDCLSPIPFQQHGLTIFKSEARFIIEEAIKASGRNQSQVYEYPSDAVAVIGMACRYPGANDVEELWDLLRSGRSTSQELSEDRVDMQRNFRMSQDQHAATQKKFYANLVDRCGFFDNEFFGIKPREATYMDPQQRLLLETSYQTLESSGYLCTHKRDDGDNVGVFIGASFTEYLANTSSHPPTAYNSVGTLRAFLCGRISHHFGWTGPAEVVDTACSSSLVAINRACKAIQSGECTMALTGGVNIISSIDNFLDLGKAGFLSPTGQCKPFDKDADGYCRSDGVGLLLLKPLKVALKDTNHIIGVICGSATNQGGLSASITVPHSPSQVTLYHDILKQAQLTPDKVSYVEGHGTGTQVGDPLEIAGIREVFGSPQRDTVLHVGSIKGSIGHCETAAGVAGCIKALVMLQKGAMPPLASHRTLNPKIPSLENDNMAITPRLQPWKAPFHAVCVNSYGAAGSNAAMILCQPPGIHSTVSTGRQRPNEALPILLSADSEFSLLAYMKDLKAYLQKPETMCSIADVAFTLVGKRQHQRFRWAAVAQDLAEVTQALTNVAGKVFEIPRRKGSIVLVFCGQVSRIVGVNRRLYGSSGLFQAHMDRCDQVIQDLGQKSLYPFIFQIEPIFDIKVLHCCLFAYQYACALSWIDSGLRVDAVVGQSFGELTALAVAGVLTLKDALDLILQRASLVETKWGPEGGSMLAIRCTIETAKQLVMDIRELGEDVEIACYNAEDSYVLGGTASAIATAEQLLCHDTKYLSVKVSRLEVTHAYHTKLTKTIIDDLDLVADSLEFKKPKIILETCTQGRLNVISSSHIRSHMRHPVYFQNAIRRLEEQLGDCVWLEAGSGSPTFSLVKRAVVTPEHHVFQPLTIKDSGDPMEGLCKVTAELWRQGVSVSYWNFHDPKDQGLRQVWLPPYHFQETQYWLPYIDHATEALKSRVVLDETQDPSNQFAVAEAPQLIKRLQSSTVSGDDGKFKLNASHRRFQEIVNGHAVLGRPLCPAGMYLECIILAMHLGSISQSNLNIRFEKCSFEAPLGATPNRDIIIKLWKSQRKQSFEVSSSTESQAVSRNIVHARGNVNLVDEAQSEQYQRLISRRVEELQASSDLDVLRKDKAYRLFSRIVQYSGMFKGISVVKLAETEALANIILEADRTGVGLFNAVSLDIFVQVLGLLINSHSICPADHAFLAVGVDSICIAQSPNSEFNSSYQVYAAFQPSEGSKAIGDVFVIQPNSSLAVVMTGIQFTKVPLNTLAKMLDTSNGTPLHEDADPVVDILQTSTLKVEPSETISSTRPEPKSEATAESNSSMLRKLAELVSQHSGCALDMVTDEATLESLGIDSLAKIELKADLETTFGRPINDSALDSGKTVVDILAQLSPNAKSGNKSTPFMPSPLSKQNDLDIDPISILVEAGILFPVSAVEHGFSDYWNAMAPIFDQLVVSYIVEAYEHLGIDLPLIHEHERVPAFNHLPKHDQLVQRLWPILERSRIISRHEGQYIRTSRSIPASSAATIHSEFNARYPQYSIDFSALAITGPNLADCLTGATDPLRLLFGNTKAQQILSDFYHTSPLLATMTDQLLLFVERIVKKSGLERVRIIEIGAGFGGTTTPLTQMLYESGCDVQYTFTDVAPTLVEKARRTFSRYPWMRFETLDLEKDPPAALQGKYDMVIATNVVHATSNLVTSTRRLKSLLRDGGFICLSEVTKPIDWYDLVFGLLPGWWCFNDGRSYPLQSAEEWMKVFEEAGFESMDYSKGVSEEAKTQQLLVASTRACKSMNTNSPSISQASGTASHDPTSQGNENVKHRMQTVVYKTIDHMDIHADIYFPETPSPNPMPITLMIHGGGFTTLSKSFVRPAQTRYLLSKNILPISLDYRLCPETNIVAGAMTDIRDAVAWARSALPGIAAHQNVVVKTKKIAVIGWSTGGHLAMTTAWTTFDAGIEPPSVILSFYAPTDMEALGKLFHCKYYPMKSR
ncbi:MAG: hypothetical protein Q9170_007540 [Blastenia crenularia]